MVPEVLCKSYRYDVTVGVIKKQSDHTDCVMLVEGRLFDWLCAKAHSLHNELLARAIC